MTSNTQGADPIRDYVRANLHTNSREAIRSRLVEAGHDLARVDAVWEQEWNAARQGGAETSLSALALSLFFVGAVIGTLGALTLLGLDHRPHRRRLGRLIP
jgi:hypothetical protein